MSRPMLLKALAVSAVLSATAHAGTVPDEALTDAKDGYFHKALLVVEPLAKAHPDDAEVQCRYGEALLGTSRADDAITALAAAVSLDPQNGFCHRLLGEAYGLKAQQQAAVKSGLSAMFSMSGLVKSARTEFETAIRFAPNDLQSHVDLAMFYIKAPGLMGGSYSKAHAEEQAVTKLDEIRGLQVQASEAGNKGDADAGEALLKQAVTKDKTSGSLIALGMFEASMKRYDGALQAFRDAEAKDPKAYVAWYQVGRTAGLAKSGYDEGIDSLKRYIAFTDRPDSIPSGAWAHFRLGNLYEYQGYKDLAGEEYRAATDLNTDGDPDLASKLKDAQSRLDEAVTQTKQANKA